MRRALPCALVVASALAVHVVAGRLLAGRDVVLALLAGDRGVTVALVVALVVARLFLFLLAPGWALHVAARIGWERYRAAGSRTPPRP